MKINELEVLEELNLAYKGIVSANFPKRQENEIQYNFFLDLENGYKVIAGSKIHVYGNETHWAIVFEINGYNNRGFNMTSDLVYVGNSIKYEQQKHEERLYTSNVREIELISEEEFERIENKKGSEMEQFELISREIDKVKVRDKEVEVIHDIAKYKELGIEVRDDDNSDNLIDFVDFIRYTQETQPEIFAISEDEIRFNFVKSDIPKIETIGKFHFVSNYEDKQYPSEQETFELIAKMIVNNDKGYWKPQEEANNHWSNWESGAL